MSDIAKILGQRIRNYRTTKGLSQEKLVQYPADIKVNITYLRMFRYIVKREDIGRRYL